MTERLIAIVDERSQARPLPPPLNLHAPLDAVADGLGRPLRDLRISVTDRCNFRCTYCMPKEVYDQRHQYLPHKELLTFEEISTVAQSFVLLGVKKIRLTGGEPLLRKDIEKLIAQLSALRTPEGHPIELTLTTNASLLQRKAQVLKDAGLHRITVSLDALDDAVFRQMNDVDFPVAEVLAGIEAASRVGLDPIKVNMVVKKGVNDDQIVPMARHFRGSGIILRFIEYMDVGVSNGWRMDEVLPSGEVIERLQTLAPLVSLSPNTVGETAERWAWADAAGRPDPALGEVGVISSVTQAFCRDCNRARLSTEGQLFLCLFASAGYDLRRLVREGASAPELARTVAAIWQGRQDRYSELRGSPELAMRSSKIEMSYIGG